MTLDVLNPLVPKAPGISGGEKKKIKKKVNKDEPRLPKKPVVSGDKKPSHIKKISKASKATKVPQKKSLSQPTEIPKKKKKKFTRKIRQDGGGIAKDAARVAKKTMKMVSDYAPTPYRAKRLYRWLFRERANIYDVDVFMNHKEMYLRTLFIYLRYRSKIEERKLSEAFQYWKPKLSLGSSFMNKGPLFLAIDRLHETIRNSVEYSGLSRLNRVCLKNCLCIAVIDTLRNMHNIVKSKVLADVIETIEQMIARGIADIVENEKSFETQFRIKFSNFDKLNFRVLNAYDYGFTFNMFYFGPFFHHRLKVYDTKGTAAGTEIEEMQKKKDSIYREVMRNYAKYVVNKKHVLPKPLGSETSPLAALQEPMRGEIIKNLLAVDKKQGGKRRFSLNGIDDDESMAMQFLQTHVDKINEYEKISYDIYTLGNDIDVLEGRDVLPLDFKERVKRIIEMYFKETDGLGRGPSDVTRSMLSNIHGWNTKFISQMEAINNECEFMYFKSHA